MRRVINYTLSRWSALSKHLVSISLHWSKNLHKTKYLSAGHRTGEFSWGVRNRKLTKMLGGGEEASPHDEEPCLSPFRAPIVCHPSHTKCVFQMKIKSDRSEAATLPNMRSNKSFCGGWKGKKMKWLLRSDVPSNKITPLYLPKQHMFPWSGRGLRHGQRQVRERQFFLQEKIPWYTSSDLASCNFPENEKLFQQQVKRNFGSLTLMMCWCPLSLKGMFH